mmetsp:Transcript_12697/g.32484  ORF Transcript_12697/g.32484 Transcript_12697/m.32484 type:complete len:202 (+) Transcript_12697:62-667(+)
MAQAAAVEEDKVLPFYCFSTLARLLGKDIPPVVLPKEYATKECPLFVTWKVQAGHHLRGCIGTFGDMQLPSGLEEYTERSALRDRRFKPVRLDEVPSLECGVSLLVDFEDGADYLDWTVGVHGIRIHLTVAGRAYSATYLPEVAGEQGWGKMDTINSLLRKAGYTGPLNKAIHSSIALQRYQSRKFHATYEEWAASTGGLK